ncbi:MAG: hypothetical protein GYB50_25360 [Rhodobacteraceae bacterium]|nr:hypothetical protein [Paracoccaceae bacterium]
MAEISTEFLAQIDRELERISVRIVNAAHEISLDDEAIEDLLPDGERCRTFLEIATDEVTAAEVFVLEVVTELRLQLRAHLGVRRSTENR